MHIPTTEIVEGLRTLARGREPSWRDLYLQAADRLEEYERDRVHGRADLAFQMALIKAQAKLLQDAYDIFQQSGEQNLKAWEASRGRTIARTLKDRLAEQADTLRHATTDTGHHHLMTDPETAGQLPITSGTLTAH